MIALEKLWKMFFISYKKLISFSRYWSFCISICPFFLPISHCFRAWSKTNLEVYDIINCLNEKLITNFIWYPRKKKRYGIETLSIDRVLNEEHFYGKIVHQKLVPDPFFILVNNPKQLLHARNSFKNKIFWKGIIKNL